MGKGSRPRPVRYDEYAAGWERAFGRGAVRDDGGGGREPVASPVVPVLGAGVLLPAVVRDGPVGEGGGE